MCWGFEDMLLGPEKDVPNVSGGSSTPSSNANNVPSSGSTGGSNTPGGSSAQAASDKGLDTFRSILECIAMKLIRSQRNLKNIYHLKFQVISCFE
jgi:hypothetical protein